jgi:hypothetical protein
MLIQGTYCSADEVNRDEAYRTGYERVCRIPREIGTLGGDDILVIDLDFPQQDLKGQAIRVANHVARSGVPVGVHTYHPDDPRVVALAANPRVTVTKTHRELRERLGALRDTYRLVEA